MLSDQIKKDNIEALKARDTIKRSILSVVIGKINTQFGSIKVPTNVEIISIIQKTIKELEDEKLEFVKLDRISQAADVDTQIHVLEAYLPQMLSEEEIKKIIASLEDKSMPSVMKHFKINYTGQVDMSLVSKIARG